MSTTEQSWLRLALAAEIGPVLGHRLLAAFETPERIFSTREAELLAVPGLGRARLARLLDPAARRAAAEEWERIQEGGVRLITLADADYPALLRRLTSPPLVLWVRGALAPEDRLAVAIVGPRNPSNYARLMVQALAPPLAAHGLTLVSGMAHGIDAEAHRAALEAAGRGTGGRTLAVLGQGLGTRLYPQPNIELGERLAASGAAALISIVPMATEPSQGLFAMRNEIIAGLALGVLVIEASPTSGTLLTARHAAAAGRVVMACPGDATRHTARGSNRLLADGAFLIQEAGDVLVALAQELRQEKQDLEELYGFATIDRTGEAGAGLGESGLDPEAAQEAAGAGGPGDDGEDEGSAPIPVGNFDLAALDPLARRIVELLAAEPLPADTILEACLGAGHTFNGVLGTLLRLEMDGHLRQLPGRLYALAPRPE